MHYFNKESPEKHLRPWVQIPLKPRIFFRGFLCNCLCCFTTAKITFTSILYPQFIYMIYIMHIIFKIMCLCQSQYSIFLHQGVDYLSISDNYWLGTTKPCITYGLRWVCLTYISSFRLQQFWPHSLSTPSQYSLHYSFLPFLRHTHHRTSFHSLPSTPTS